MIKVSFIKLPPSITNKEMRLEMFITLLIVCSLFCCACIADKSDVGKTRKVKTCAHKCGACFTDGDLLGRMGCVEMCELGDADDFTCTVGGNVYFHQRFNNIIVKV